MHCRPLAKIVILPAPSAAAHLVSAPPPPVRDGGFFNDDRPQISLHQPNTSLTPACFVHRLTSQRLISPPSGPSAPHSTDLIPTPDTFCACALCMKFRSHKKKQNTSSTHRHKSVFVSAPPAHPSTPQNKPAPVRARRLPVPLPPLPAVSAPAARSPRGKRPYRSP